MGFTFCTTRLIRDSFAELFFNMGNIPNPFPIISEQDEKEFGSYRTKNLILAYVNVLPAGDTETAMSV